MITITITSQGNHSFTHKDLSVHMADNMLYSLKRDSEVISLQVRSSDQSNFNYDATRQADGTWSAQAV